MSPCQGHVVWVQWCHTCFENRAFQAVTLSKCSLNCISSVRVSLYKVTADCSRMCLSENKWYQKWNSRINAINSICIKCCCCVNFIFLHTQIISLFNFYQLKKKINILTHLSESKTVDPLALFLNFMIVFLSVMIGFSSYYSHY